MTTPHLPCQPAPQPSNEVAGQGLARLARYEAQVELTSGLLEVSSAEDVWAYMARHLRFSIDALAWRLVVCTGSAVYIGAARREDSGLFRSSKVPHSPEQSGLKPWDQAAWARWVPRWLDAAELATLPERPWPLEDSHSAGLWEQPLMDSEGQPLALLSLQSAPQRFTPLDRKFARLAGLAVAARLLSLEQAEQLQTQLLAQQARHEEQQRAVILQHFISGIRHELNTPLSLQGSWLDLIDEAKQRGEVPSDLLDSARQSMKQSQAQMVRLMEAIKSCSGQLASEGQEPVELQSCLSHYLEIRQMRRADPPTALLVSSSFRARAWLEPHALPAVLDELLDNVALHAPGASAVMRLTTDAQGTHLEIDDNGPGWPGGAAHHLVLPFSRHTNAPGRMGLGGFIAHNLAIELLGAKLGPAPSQRGGACVRLSWPLDPARRHVPLTALLSLSS